MIVLLPTASDPLPAIDFDTDVIPVLTKYGCNSGSCHGAAAGRGGFRLSLFGSEPARDYEAIVHELEGRRVNFARPLDSLVVAKPTGAHEHSGGVRFAQDEPAYRRLVAWIRDGARRTGGRRLVRFNVSPGQMVAEHVGQVVSLRATADFEPGGTQDVTEWTVFAATDPDGVTVAKSAPSVTLRRAGRHVVTARFLDRVVPLLFLVPIGSESIDHRNQPRHNMIDDELLAVLEQARLPVAPAVDDAGFLRRAQLDLTGRLPEPDEIRDFLADTRPAKRLELVDRLMASDAFADYWTYKLATMLRIRSRGPDQHGTRLFHHWLREQIRRRIGWDEIVRTMLVAVGDTHEVGPANFHLLVDDARQQAEYVGQALLGVRLRCANCHNHPLDRWTQDDYHGLAAIFARLERGRVVRIGRRGEVTHPRSGSPAVPRLPTGRELDGLADPRRDLADWLVDPNNPYFARALVNRLWKWVMGRGLVEPVDDLRDTNPATHPRLLERLADDFVQHGYDLRHTLRRITTSAAYARAAMTPGVDVADGRFYARAAIRPLDPEVLADAICDVTGVHEPFGAEPVGTHAVALFDPQIPSELLDVLGRCSRSETCEMADGGIGGLSARLRLINGPSLNQRIESTGGRLQRVINAGADTESIVAEFYWRCFSRPPTDPERRFWHEQIPSGANPTDRRARLQDFLWALLTSREFVTNH
jgi:hypothetical protein